MKQNPLWKLTAGFRKVLIKSFPCDILNKKGGESNVH